MRDIFYTILIVWVLWRILSSINNHKRKTPPPSQPSQGDTKVEYTPPKKKKFGDDEGEYVDYEEMK